MFEIGASLREARNRRGLTLDDVQKGLRIRERYLIALEDEAWDVLPGEAYVKGFLRTYAEFLGLNGTLYLDEFNARFAAPEEEPFVPESLAPSRGSRILTRTIVGVVAVAVIAGGLAALGSGRSAAPHLSVPVAAAAPKPAAPLGMPVAPVVLPKPKPPTARIRAVSSRSWLSVRLDGPAGREVFRGYLTRGHTLSYALQRNVWLRIGRPRALAIRIGAYRVGRLPGVPVNLLLTRNGPKAG
jgi:cytoskeleton protein RodZ